MLNNSNTETQTGDTPKSLLEGATTFRDLMDAVDMMAPGLLEVEPKAGTGYAWFRHQLKRFTYKPGWKLEVFPSDAALASCVLVISWRVDDSRKPGEQVTVQSVHPLYSGAHDKDPDAFADALAHYIRAAEHHESREWLRRDGEIYDDPHS